MAGKETEVREFVTHIWSASFTTMLIFTGSVCPARWRIFLDFRLPGCVIIMPGLGWEAVGMDSESEFYWIVTAVSLFIPVVQSFWTIHGRDYKTKQEYCYTTVINQLWLKPHNFILFTKELAFFYNGHTSCIQNCLRNSWGGKPKITWVFLFFVFFVNHII